MRACGFRPGCDPGARRVWGARLRLPHGKRRVLALGRHACRARVRRHAVPSAGARAVIMSRAPMRSPLGGGGTDLPSYYSRSGGFILAAAIDKYLYICLNRPSADELIRLKYSRYEEVADTADIEHDLVRPA